MSRLNLLFSGQYQVLLNNQMVNLGYNKVRALLAYLVIEREQAHSRDELAGLLWPDNIEPIGRKNLRQAIMNLRFALEDDEQHPACLLIKRESIQVNVDADFFVDILALSDLLQQSQNHAHAAIETCPVCYQRLVQAADLYKGDFLAGFSIPDSLRFEEWLIFVRERSRLQIIEILGILVLANEIKHDNATAIQYSRKRLALDPWNEDAYRALMRTLWRTGQRTTALAEFERCKRILADDLEISPSRETIDLADIIRRDASSQIHRSDSERAEAEPPIPVPLTAMIGRESEAQSLTMLLHQSETRLVTLLGPPGVGKTRLALHLAQQLKSEYGQDLIYISLTSITNQDVVIETIAHALGFGAGTQLTSLEYLESGVLNPKKLIVLDNFEHVTSEARSLLKILQVYPQMKFLVTSQIPLHIRGEQRFYLKPLQLPDLSESQDVQNILSTPAVKLFFETAKRYIPDINFGRKNSLLAAEICTRLDGLPLAIELAAANLKILSLKQLHEKICDTTAAVITTLRDQNRDKDARHQTLRQAFQWSFDLLNPEARTLFSRLAVFNDSWSLEAADAVCNIGDIQAENTNIMLLLLENCLIQRIETQSGEYRFTMLATIRDFALEHIQSPAEIETLHQRHTDYFLTFAILAEPELSDHHQMDWLERIEQDRDNFRTAIDWALENSPHQALQLCVAFFPYWHIRAFLAEGQTYLERACENNPHPSHLRSRALAAAGLLAQRQGNYSHARKLVDESIIVCRQLNDLPGLAYALNNLAIILMSTGDQANAFARANESLAICQELNDPLGIARAQMILGQLTLDQDNLPSAWQLLSISLKYWQKKGDFKNQVLCLINLGRIRIAQGQYLEAENILKESLELSRKIKDRHWELVATWNLGDIQLQSGKLAEAQPIFSGILEQTVKLGDRYFEALTLDRLGIIAILNNHFSPGEDYLKQSLEIGQSMGSDWMIANAIADQGLLAYLQGNYANAYRSLVKSAQMFLKQNDQANLIQTLERLAMVDFCLERPEQAVWILSTAVMWRHSKNEPAPPAIVVEINKTIRGLKTILRSDIFDHYWTNGQDVSLQQLVSSIEPEPLI